MTVEYRRPIRSKVRYGSYLVMTKKEIRKIVAENIFYLICHNFPNFPLFSPEFFLNVSFSCRYHTSTYHLIGHRRSPTALVLAVGCRQTAMFWGLFEIAKPPLSFVRIRKGQLAISEVTKRLPPMGQVIVVRKLQMRKTRNLVFLAGSLRLMHIVIVAYSV